MRTILAICREHGQAPSWFDEQPRDDQIIMLASRRFEAKERARALREAKRRRRRR